jgi:hypothetical protein
LQTGRPLRKRRRRAHERRIRFVALAVLIDQRPVAVEGHGRIGDWEGDLILGRMSRSAIGTLVERSSRYRRLIHLPHGHSGAQLRAALVVALSGLAPQARLTLTWDQGSEMAQHHLLVEHFREGIYFARPASPWQRGTNENTNGLLRQYFPKGTDLSTHGLALRAVEDRLNHRPRKTLGWRTPAELMVASWHHDPVIVATVARIHPGTRLLTGGQFSDAVDKRARGHFLGVRSAWIVMFTAGARGVQDWAIRAGECHAELPNALISLLTGRVGDPHGRRVTGTSHRA